jgi:hypothetical protein
LFFVTEKLASRSLNCQKAVHKLPKIPKFVGRFHSLDMIIKIKKAFQGLSAAIALALATFALSHKKGESLVDEEKILPPNSRSRVLAARFRSQSFPPPPRRAKLDFFSIAQQPELRFHKIFLTVGKVDRKLGRIMSEIKAQKILPRPPRRRSAGSNGIKWNKFTHFPPSCERQNVERRAEI